jgi:hypothetical protein
LWGVFALSLNSKYYEIMYTYLEITSGSNKGMVYRLQTNMRLGSSSQCEIPLLDPEAPPIHSMIMLDQKDQMVLVCTNAVYEIIANNRAVKKTVLQDDKFLQVSNVHLRVRVTQKPLIGAVDPFILKQVEPKNATVLTPNEILEINDQSRVTVVENPKFQLIKELNALLDSFSTPFPHPHSFKLFRRPFLLKVETGPQADDEFLVSWGPRDFGPQSLEFQLEFPPFPAILFTLSPGSAGEIVFSTNHPNFASVSGQVTPTDAITEGSKIIAGNSTISVEFLDDIRGPNDQG